MTRPPDVLHASGAFESLILLARSGYSDALGQLFEPYRPTLVKHAHALLDRQLRRKMDGLDLVQEVFLEVKKGLVKFKGTSASAWEAWLKQVLVHEVRDIHRRYRQTAKRNLGL